MFTIDDIVNNPDLLPAGFLEDLRVFLAHYEENACLPGELEAEKEAGDADDVSNDFLYAVMDIRDRKPTGKRKWYSDKTTIGDRTGSTRLTKKKGLCFHHTAVKGGFGAHKSRLKVHMKAAVDMAAFVKSTMVLSQEEWARAMALADRFASSVPYHAVMGANSVLYLVRPFDWVTWHGNGSNTDFLGVAWDAKSSVESPVAEDLIQDVRHLVETARAEGHDIQWFTAHCAYTNKRLDPGDEFVKNVMVPAAKELGCRIDWDFKSKKHGSKSLREIAPDVAA